MLKARPAIYLIGSLLLAIVGFYLLQASAGDLADGPERFVASTTLLLCGFLLSEYRHAARESSDLRKAKTSIAGPLIEAVIKIAIVDTTLRSDDREIMTVEKVVTLASLVEDAKGEIASLRYKYHDQFPRLYFHYGAVLDSIDALTEELQSERRREELLGLSESISVALRDLDKQTARGE